MPYDSGIDWDYVDDYPFPGQRERARQAKLLVESNPSTWTPKLAREWIDATGLEAWEIPEWRDAGWTLEDAKTVHVVGDRGVASGWLESGLPGHVAAAYVEAGVKIQEALRLEAAGQRPNLEALKTLAGLNLDNEKWRENWDKALDQTDTI